MKTRALLIALLSFQLLNCEKRKTTEHPKAVQQEMSEHSKPNPIDTALLKSMRFMQLLKSETDSSYFTQDDCRCIQSTASFSSNGEFIFSVCDSIYSGSRYAVQREVSDSDGITLFATHQDSADTIRIKVFQASPAIYEIIRSNYFEVESGNLFINVQDSSKFEHHHWDCDEYQG
jgi:hypothetical protein